MTRKTTGKGRRAGAAEIPASRESKSHPGKSELYSADRPITRRNQDRFNRWPFARRIATTISEFSDPSSLVVGLYAPWGDGKTSTLRLMEEALEADPNVIVFSFNPWQFGSEEHLLRAFFDSLADGLGRSLATRKEEIGKTLKKYGSILSIASVNVAHAVKLDPGKGLAQLGEALSSVKLDELKARLEKILGDTKKRVVILIDDIDRLDRLEIHALFKLIKASASFDYTNYVLAFDDEMVAAALGERYGGGGSAAGRSFLEKIVHIPLHLPPVDSAELHNVAFEGVDAALSKHQISLSREQIERFVRIFTDAIEPQMQTPRQAKRLVNAIAFALPMLKGEVEPVDLMLIECVRVFFPKLYAGIRDNPAVFAGRYNESGDDPDARQKRLHELVEPTLKEAGVSDRQVVYRRLIEPLFPRTGRTGYGHEWNAIWASEQRICSTEYFHRYFSYSVPPGDVGDLEVQEIVDDAEGGSVSDDEMDQLLGDLSKRRAIPRLISKLRYREKTLNPVAARRLALLIARNGVLLPKEEGPFSLGGTATQGAILVRFLIQRMEPDHRGELASHVINSAHPLPFAAECFRWIQHSGDRPEDDRLISALLESGVAAALCTRIRKEAKSGPLYRTYGRDTLHLLWLWKTLGSPGEMGRALKAWLNSSVDEVDHFLDTFVGRGWGLESGLSRRLDFDRRAYDLLAELSDPEFVAKKLLERHKNLRPGDADLEPTTTQQTYRKVASQFLAVHKAVQEQKGSASSSPASAASDDSALKN